MQGKQWRYKIHRTAVAGGSVVGVATGSGPAYGVLQALSQRRGGRSWNRFSARMVVEVVNKAVAR